MSSSQSLDYPTILKHVKAFNGIYLNTDSGRISILASMNLSTAFDTVDHTQVKVLGGHSIKPVLYPT